MSEADRPVLGLCRNCNGRRCKCDSGGGGIERLAGVIPDLAIELNAVPFGIGGDGFAGVCSRIPHAPRAVALLFEIPLVAQACPLRLDRKGDAFAGGNGLALRLGGDFQRLGYRNNRSLGIDLLAGAVAHKAANLHSVPRGIGCRGGGGGGMPLPERPVGLPFFPVVPLVFESGAFGGDAECDIAVSNGNDVFGLGGDFGL